MLNEMDDYRGWGRNGPKPCGMISVGGVPHFAMQNSCGSKPPVYGSLCQHGSDVVMLSSRDLGETRTPALGDIKEPRFPGWKFGGLTFVNSGKDNATARDEYVCAVSGDQWDNGSGLRIGRVRNDRIRPFRLVLNK